MKYLREIEGCALFDGVSAEQLEGLLDCLQARPSSFSKGETILEEESVLSAMGLLLEGEVHIVKEDYLGNRNIIAIIKPSDLFGESYACSDGEKLNVNVICAKDCQVLFLNTQSILERCQNFCESHRLLVSNLMHIMAAKNILLSKKLDHLTKRTTREKVLSFLSEKSMEKRSLTFEIPFNRQQMADFLCVDRSALSRELMKLKEEGYLDYDKNQFRLNRQWISS